MEDLIMKKTCTECGTEKAIEEFGWRNKAKKIRHAKCKECKKRYWKQYYRESYRQYAEVNRQRKLKYVERNQKFIADYLGSHVCIDCGESDIVVLTFDHVKGQKKFNICDSGKTGYAIKTIEKEINKCEYAAP
jgi:hypothetical protein